MNDFLIFCPKAALLKAAEKAKKAADRAAKKAKKAKKKPITTEKKDTKEIGITSKQIA